MKIYGITNQYRQSKNIYFKSENQEPKPPLSTTEKIAGGVIATLGLGIGAYYLFRGKKVPKTPALVPPKPTPPIIPPVIPPVKPLVPENITETVKNIVSSFKSEVPAEPIFTKLKNGKTKVVFENNTTVGERYRDTLVFDASDNLNLRFLDYKEEKTGKNWMRAYKGSQEKLLTPPDKLPKGRHDDDYLLKEYATEGFKPFDSYIKGGFEKTNKVSYPNGTAKTYQTFYRPDKKAHQVIVHDEVFVNILGCFCNRHTAQSVKAVQYDYAYKNNKLSAIAKIDILKDGHWHGVYQNNGFDAFPQYVDLKDGNGFKEFKGDLYMRMPEFDLEKMI